MFKRPILLITILVVLLFSTFILLRSSANGVRLSEASLQELIAAGLSAKKTVDSKDSAGQRYKRACTGPARIITIAGTGSTDHDPDNPDPTKRKNNPSQAFHDFVNRIPEVQANREVNLNEEEAGNLEEVKANILSEINAELDKEPYRKVLIIAHSLGAVLVQNLLTEGKLPPECVRLIQIDPPHNHSACKWDIFGFSDYCRAIKNAKKVPSDPKNPIVDLTDGTAKPSADHDPFTYPQSGDNKDHLKEIKKRIQDEIEKCKKYKSS